MTHKKKDANHAGVSAIMTACGALVIDCTAAPRLGFDAIAIHHGKIAFIEVKDGTLPASKRKLTTNEMTQRMRITTHGGEYVVLLDEEQAQCWCEDAARQARREVNATQNAGQVK